MEKHHNRVTPNDGETAAPKTLSLHNNRDDEQYKNNINVNTIVLFSLNLTVTAS